MDGSSTTMTVRLAAEVKERLDRLAEATSRSRSWLAAEAISGYVETQAWQIAEIEDGARDADAGDFASEEEVAAVFAKWSDAT